jgi:5-methylcytosine-specific restriction endonuclease McrA
MPIKAKPTCGKGHERPPGKHCNQCNRERALARYRANRETINQKRNIERRGTYASRVHRNSDGDPICHNGHVREPGIACQLCRVAKRREKSGGTCKRGHPRDYTERGCTICSNEYQRQWMDAHRQEQRAASLNNYYRRKAEGLVECSTEKTKAWKRANPERARELAVQAENKRRILKLNAEGSHTLAEWKAIVERQGGVCAACGFEKKLTRDHIVPLSKGGSDYATNIQGLCGPCNSRKGARLGEL